MKLKWFRKTFGKALNQSPSENTVLEQSDLGRSQREKFALKRYEGAVALPENIENVLNCSNVSDPET